MLLVMRKTFMRAAEVRCPEGSLRAKARPVAVRPTSTSNASSNKNAIWGRVRLDSCLQVFVRHWMADCAHAQYCSTYLRSRHETIPLKPEFSKHIATVCVLRCVCVALWQLLSTCSVRKAPAITMRSMYAR